MGHQPVTRYCLPDTSEGAGLPIMSRFRPGRSHVVTSLLGTLAFPLEEKLSEPFEVILAIAAMPIQVTPRWRNRAPSLQPLEPIGADLEAPAKIRYSHPHSPPSSDRGGYRKREEARKRGKIEDPRLLRSIRAFNVLHQLPC
jgi:hypothetical protein